MYDIKFIREFPEDFDHAMKMRGIDISAKIILEKDTELRRLKTELQELRAEKNEINKNLSSVQKSEDLIKKSETLKAQINELSTNVDIIEKELYKTLSALPNMPAADVPFGTSSNDNIELYKIGSIKEFDFKIKHHFELFPEQMDFVQSAKISGSRFVLLKGQLALLERALANFMLDIHTNEFGFIEVATPVLVRDSAMFGAGQLPKFSEDSFTVDNGAYRLIPTSEVTLVNLISDMIIKENELPMRFTAYTQCFRSEAGSAGKDTRGMIRMHQFSKVELVSITTPENSNNEHDRILNAAETILEKLQIPYRVVLLCSQDMGFSSKKTYDIEVWCPAQKSYREISSCSNCGNFQAIRMNSRYKTTAGENRRPHTLNGSGLAVGRTIVAIMENYQQSDGSVSIPDALKPYMNNFSSIKSL